VLSEQFIEQQGRPTPNSPRGGGGGGNNGHGRGGSTANLGRGGSRSSLTSPTTPGRRSSGTVSVPVTTSSTSNIGRGGNTSPTATRARPAQQQTVRSLIPPRATNRGPDDGLDDAPPSYEQAAKQAAYVPAPGHPSHPASSPRGEGPATTRPPALAPPVLQPVTASSPPMVSSNNGRGRMVSNSAAYPGAGRGIRPAGVLSPAPIGNTHGSGRERDCVVM
jgi:hypothetical protein